MVEHYQARTCELMISTILSIWGAAVATILAGVRLWELWRARMRIHSFYSFSSLPENEQEIILANTSGTPVMIEYWELLWMRRSRPFWKWETTDGRFPDEGRCNITIEPHSRHTLFFGGLDWFDTSAKAAHRGSIFLKLHVIGQRAVWLKVYEPRSWGLMRN